MGFKRQYPIILITIIVISMVSLLTLANGFIGNRIQAQKDEQTVEMLMGIFPETSFYTIENNIYTVFDKSQKKLGSAFYAEGEGWSGKIVILVGLADKETIKGIIILSHNEKYTWGEGYTQPLNFSSLITQFAGLKIASCDLKKNGGNINGIAGATTSSKAVIEAVRNTALAETQFIK